VTPVWGVWLDGAFAWSGSPASRWARNLVTNPAISLHLESGSEVVIVEGDAAHIEGDDALTAAFIAAWDTKYGIASQDTGTRTIFQLSPVRARSWSHSIPAAPTRWEFRSR
jgi:hypothetical protein